MNHQARSKGLSPFVRGFAQLFELSPDELECLAELEAGREDVPARRTVMDEGRRYDHALIVLDGWISEQKLLRNGKRQILNFRLPGEIAGIDNLAYAAATHSVATLTPCTVARLSSDAFERLQRNFPRIGSGLFFMTLRKEVILHQWEVSLGRRDAYARVAHLLLELHRRLELRGLTEGEGFRLPATQEDVADCVGLTTPYVNRILKAMRGEGLIAFEDRLLRILNTARLAKSAGFKPAYLDGWRSEGRTSP
jgi:CRP-like cAMP-binding protein